MKAMLENVSGAAYSNGGWSFYSKKEFIHEHLVEVHSDIKII